MSETRPQSGEVQESPAPRKRRGKKLFLLVGVVVLLGGGAGAAWQFVPGVADKVHAMVGHHEPVAAVAVSTRPVFMDLPEMALTLPNGGHPRQMRIKLSVELAPGASQQRATEALSPRVYDALLTYLRTLQDGEIDGGLGLDRLRADLYRRLELVVGPGVLRDVLITSLVMA
jgi:flagellar FliL protein